MPWFDENRLRQSRIIPIGFSRYDYSLAKQDFEPSKQPLRSTKQGVPSDALSHGPEEFGSDLPVNIAEYLCAS